MITFTCKRTPLQGTIPWRQHVKRCTLTGERGASEHPSKEKETFMDDENLGLDHLSLNRAIFERIDGILLAVAGRLWEVARDTTPQGHQAAKTAWPAKEMRTMSRPTYF